MSLQRGNECEAQVATKLLELGYTISLPFGGGSPYDLIADKDGVLLKVQVKSTSYDGEVGGAKRERIVLTRGSRRGERRPYRPVEVDYFVVVTRSKAFYVIPYAEAVNLDRVTITVSEKVQRYLEAWF